MTVRQATEADVPDLVEMGRHFHAYSPYADLAFDAEATGAFIATMVDGGGVFRTDDGMCGGLLSPIYFSPQHIVGAELFWWAPKGGGRALRDAFEAWARSAGATHVQFSALGNDHFDKVAENFERNGFQRAETSFVKRV